MVQSIQNFVTGKGLRHVGNVVAVLVGLAGSAITILLAFEHWYPQAHPDGRIAIITLAFFVSVATVAVVWQEYRYSRRAKYAEGFSYLKQIFYETSTCDTQRMASAGEIEELCRLIVNRLAGAFSLVSGTKCSVCIKVLVESGDEEEVEPSPEVATLCRDDTSLERERGASPIEHWLEELENPEAVQHFVKDNTDFQQVFERVGTAQRVFFSNYLPGEKNYRNTSFEIYGRPKRYLKGLRWPLPYRSTIVAPISHMNRLRRECKLAGYLCVDSASRLAFSRRYDSEVLTAVGDCMFNLVHRYNDLVSDVQSGEGEYGDE